MELNSLSLSDFVKLGDVIFLRKLDSLPVEARASGMFKISHPAQNTGNAAEYSEIDTQEYARFKAQGDQATRAKVQQGYSKTITSYRVALDIGITFEMRTQNKYQEVVSRLENLAVTGVNRMELDLTHQITFGAATSYTDMDGRSVNIAVGDTLALFSTAHTLKGSSTTFRNILANSPQLSRGALEGMETLFVEQSYNHFGEKVVMKPDVLFTTDDPTTINTARVLLRSTASVDAGQNSGVINVNANKYRHVVLSRLATAADGSPNTSKAKYWGLASTMHTSAYLDILEEPHLKMPSSLNAGEEFSTDDWNFGVRVGYRLGIVNGNWIKISYGDGTA